MANLALADLVAPYVLKGENLGTNHAALSLIRVTQFEIASDEFGVAIRGRAEFDGRGLFDPSGGLKIIGKNEAQPPFDPSKREPVFDWGEAAVEFELFVPRDGSLIIGQAAGSITAAGFSGTKDVLDVWDALPVDPAPSDYPASGFRLDLILDLPSLRPPFLHPAKMDDRGLLVDDDTVKEVSLILPRLRFRLAHGNPLDSRLSFELVSAGTSGLDDPSDLGVADLIEMSPPYAFIGGKDDKKWGVGFRKAVLDLSNETTPPDIVDKFGFGDDWGGLYLPELRVFFAPDWKNLAFNAGVTDLLLGLGDSHGLSGDFELDVIRHGGGDLVVGARFFDANNKPYGLQFTSKTEATVALPAQTRMVVDIQGGMPPYTATLSVIEHDDDSGGDSDPSPPETGRLFNIQFNGPDHTRSRLIVKVKDSASGTPKEATLTITATLLQPQKTLAKPGDTSTGPNKKATWDEAAIDPNIIILFENDDRTQVTLSTDPQNPNLMWSVVDPPGGAESGPSSTFDLPLAPGETKKVRARLPAVSVDPQRVYYFQRSSPPRPSNPQAPDDEFAAFAAARGNVSTTPARSVTPADGFDPGGESPFAADSQIFDAVVPPGSTITIKGESSVENDGSDRNTNYHLAHRRAAAVRAGLEALHGARNFHYAIDPEPEEPTDYPDIAAWEAEWRSHNEPDVAQRRQHWSATVTLPPGLNRPERSSQRTISRAANDAQPPAEPKVNDPPAPHEPPPPSWFRSAKLKLRVVQDALIAGEVDMEIDLRTAAEERVTATGQVPGGAAPPPGHTLQNGTPLGPDNPADGITQFRFLVQKDQATGEMSLLVQFGADPADKDGLFAMGWMPGQPMPPDKDLWLTLAGAYLSFWPMLVDFADGDQGGLVDASLSPAALAIPGAIALIPWFRVERIILFGGEALEQGGPTGGAHGYFLFDVETDWSADIAIGGADLVKIDREFPLAVRYKAIGLGFGDDGSGTTSFPLRPVFDASRGFTIDVARGGSIHVADPFSKFLKILAARLSRTNPLTFEVDIGCGVDLGVVSIDRARLRVYLEEPMRAPELTAFGASIDVPGALAGSGYLELGPGDQPNTSKIGGQIDLTIRPVSLRVAAAFEMQDVADPNDPARHATAVYVGLNLVLPVGIPLANSGLGIFGFRGIFGMHYARNAALGGNTAAPALGWLQASEGSPHLIQSPTQHNVLWKPQIDNWAFGVGVLLGTMEGGFILNLDGTLLLELPGPRVAVVMNARIIQPPPSIGEMGNKGGILAIIEITPDHLLIGAILDYDIASLIKIHIPVESFFNFHDSSDWHFYLGQRAAPVSVSVLDFVKATGYLMLRGNGLPALPERNLPAVTGFAIGAGAAASFTWGDTDVGLYLKVAGGFDAVIGFDPFLLAGEFTLSGELRLFIVSVGASAKLDILVVGETDHFDTYIHGEACGHVDFFFFSVEGCVSITINSANSKPGLPDLVQKLALKSRSPALLVGTGVDRPIDASLGEGVEQANPPAADDARLPVVPIDSVVVLNMAMPPVAAGLTFAGAPVAGSTGVAPGTFVPRGSENYQYTVTAVTLERADGGPALLGSNAPAVWWTPGDSSSDNVNAQLALLTWEPDPATKAVEKTDYRKEQIKEHWGRTCQDAAPPTRVLWTFLDERLGPSVPGWDLEGIAWPDPPNTRRKLPADTEMRVTEAWRSGDARIDAMRGILPATVLGGRIKCAHPTGGQRPPVGGVRPGLNELLDRTAFSAGLARRLDGLSAPAAPARVARLAANAELKPTTRLLEKIAAADAIPAGADPIAVARLVGAGGAVGRQQIGAALLGQGAAAAASDANCDTRVLQSPIFDDGRLIVFGSQKDREEVRQALEAAGLKHGPLNDVVVIHTGPFKDANVLLFVRRALLIGDQTVVRTLAADGTELSRVPLRDSDLVSAKPLPGQWTDPAGPWSADVADALGWAQDPRALGYMAVWITAKGGEKAARIEIGIVDPARNEQEAAANSQKMGLVPPYYLAAFDMLSFAEVARAESEQTEILHERAILTQILGPGPTDDAYLVPDRLYKVTAAWTGTRQSDNAAAGKTQTYWFRTDAVAPARLDPWVLLTNPADGEAHAFRLDPVQIVFNTHNVDRLFGAYGKELRVRFTASSANHPQPTPSVPHPFPLNAQSIKPAGPGILSPWEEALEEVVVADGLTCIPIDIDRVRQSETTIQIPLDPFTDYRMDVMMVDAGAPDSAEGTRIYRRSFSTGAYDSLKHFASDLQSASIAHRGVAPGAMESVRAFFNGRPPQGAELDEQLRAAGLDVPEHAPGPRVLILWEQAGANPPQPTAVLIDAPEPLWRSRPYPRKVIDSTGPANATRWVLGSRDWLELQSGTGSDAAIAPNGFVRAPGDQRALVVLGAGNRGRRFRLDLVRTANTDPYLPIAEERYTVVDLVLVQAPWEE